MRHESSVTPCIPTISQPQARRALFVIGAIVLSATSASAMATVTDVGQYVAGKTANYTQTGTGTPTIASINPYEFQTEIDNGSSGTILASSTLTPPAGATGTVTYAINSDNTRVKDTQYFTSANALNSAFPDGNYTFTINTSTPNTYTSTLALSGITYPTDIPTISNTSWSGGNLVIDPTVNNTITWNASNDAHLSFGLENSSAFINAFNTGSGLPTSYMIPANTLLPGVSYAAQLDVAVGTLNTSSISGVLGATYYQDATYFTVVTTPEPAAGFLLLLGAAAVGLMVRRRNLA